MLRFVNAKLNLGLSITHRRPDGYHDLETVFLPVGLFNGTPENPEPFCDLLEITPLPSEGDGNACFKYFFSGRAIDCPPEKNLVIRAANAFRSRVREKHGEGYPCAGFRVELVKNLPDGAGLGGGSADASFVLTTLNRLCDSPLTHGELMEAALSLGADCPFFIDNRPAFARGVGERLEPISLDLSGWWALIVKPDVYVSTREAFAGVTPRPARFDLRALPDLPVVEWRGHIFNDFEESIFPQHPELARIKEWLYEHGAAYASMSGSGSSLFGLFPHCPELPEIPGSKTYRCLL